RWPFFATFSPDGKWVAYSVGGDGLPTLLVRPVDGEVSREEVLQENGHMMGWTPDGSGVLFSRARGGSFDLYIQPVAAGKAIGAPNTVWTSANVGQRPVGVTS